MSKHKIIKIVILLFLTTVSNILILKYANLKYSDITLNFNVVSDKADVFQVFYSDELDWTEENSQKVKYVDIGKEQKLEFRIPYNTEKLRFDLGTQVANICISDIEFSYLGKKTELVYNKLLDRKNLTQISNIENKKNELLIKTSGTDPFIIYNLDEQILLSYKNTVNYVLKALLCIVIDLLLYVIIKKSRSVLILVQDLFYSKTLIWSLAKNDFKTKYAGSNLGIVWAFIQPIVTIVVYWFVFEFGLKASTPVKNVPFVLWFAIGMIPWFFFSDAITNAANCLFEYSYLVKKVVFKISILPIVKIISSLFVHVVFLGFMTILFILYGLYPNKYIIQLPYYIFCVFSLVLAISYATSSIILFFKDLGQVISIILQVGMWATPIIWSYSIVPSKYQWIVKLNPMYYIVEGYRDSFINKIWFFEKYFQTIYFWIIVLSIFGIGALIYKKLKPHFADVL